MGLQAIPRCDPLSNNANMLYHYRLIITPETNFVVSLLHYILHYSLAVRHEHCINLSCTTHTNQMLSVRLRKICNNCFSLIEFLKKYCLESVKMKRKKLKYFWWIFEVYIISSSCGKILNFQYMLLTDYMLAYHLLATYEPVVTRFLVFSRYWL